MPEEGFARQPEQHGRILAHGPQHGQVIEMLIGFPENIDALIFQLAKVLHHGSLRARILVAVSDSDRYV